MMSYEEAESSRNSLTLSAGRKRDDLPRYSSVPRDWN